MRHKADITAGTRYCQLPGKPGRYWEVLKRTLGAAGEGDTGWPAHL